MTSEEGFYNSEVLRLLVDAWEPSNVHAIKSWTINAGPVPVTMIGFFTENATDEFPQHAIVLAEQDFEDMVRAVRYGFARVREATEAKEGDGDGPTP